MERDENPADVTTAGEVARNYRDDDLRKAGGKVVGLHNQSWLLFEGD